MASISACFFSAAAFFASRAARRLASASALRFSAASFAALALGASRFTAGSGAFGNPNLGKESFGSSAFFPTGLEAFAEGVLFLAGFGNEMVGSLGRLLFFEAALGGDFGGSGAFCFGGAFGSEIVGNLGISIFFASTFFGGAAFGVGAGADFLGKATFTSGSFTLGNSNFFSTFGGVGGGVLGIVGT